MECSLSARFVVSRKPTTHELPRHLHSICQR
jgi:hypothetical protein